MLDVWLRHASTKSNEIFALTYFVTRHRPGHQLRLFFYINCKITKDKKKVFFVFLCGFSRLCFRALVWLRKTKQHNKKENTNKSQRVTTFENENLGQMHLSLVERSVKVARRAQQSVSVCYCNCCRGPAGVNELFRRRCAMQLFFFVIRGSVSS
jgi:hypothetical protein